MKKIIGTIALIISFVLLANTKVAASTFESEANNNTLLTKQELVQILDEKLRLNVKIELDSIAIPTTPIKTEYIAYEVEISAPSVINKQINADG